MQARVVKTANGPVLMAQLRGFERRWRVLSTSIRADATKQTALVVRAGAVVAAESSATDRHDPNLKVLNLVVL
jgi:hypothetical protein